MEKMSKQNYKLAWMRIPCQGITGQGESKMVFEGMKDFIAVNGPDVDEDGKPYVTVFFWKKVG